MYIKNKNVFGAFLCLFSASLWGITGSVGQFLFQNTGISSKWLASFRMFSAGILLVTFLLFRKKKDVFDIWKNKKDRKDLLLFSIFGILFAQYGYFIAIDHSNAATATVLQYLAPIILVLYSILHDKKLPTPLEAVAICFAIFGTALLATHGDLKNLSISSQALFWGLISAFALAFYTAFPHRLLQKYDAILLIAWGMLIGGFCTNLIHPFWVIDTPFHWATIFCVAFVILFGAMLPYFTFLLGVKYVGPTKASLLGSIEPLSSTVVSVLWLHTKLEFIDYIGFLLIITTVFLLSIKPKEKHTT